jgi:hypothetical protein
MRDRLADERQSVSGRLPERLPASRPEEAASAEQDDEKDDDQDGCARHRRPRTWGEPPALKSRVSLPTGQVCTRRARRSAAQGHGVPLMARAPEEPQAVRRTFMERSSNGPRLRPGHEPRWTPAPCAFPGRGHEACSPDWRARRPHVWSGRSLCAPSATGIASLPYGSTTAKVAGRLPTPPTNR